MQVGLVVQYVGRARERWAKSHGLAQLCSGGRVNYNMMELTEQQMELMQLHNQVRRVTVTESRSGITPTTPSRCSRSCWRTVPRLWRTFSTPA